MEIQDGKSTAEFKAYVACTSKLVSTFKGDLSIADNFLEKGLISIETYDDVCSHSFGERTKATKLLSGVRNKIEVDKMNFDVLLDILNERPYCTELYKRLSDERKALCMEVTRTTSTNPRNSWDVMTIFLSSMGIFLVVLLFLHQPTEIKTALKAKYQKLEEIDFEQYLPRSMSQRNLSFISPSFEIVDGFKGRELLSVNQLLGSVESGSRLAVIGRPGAGKSTFARHVAKIWANGSALENIDMLFQICLGKSNTSITNTHELLGEECHDVDVMENLDIKDQQLVDKLKFDKGRGVAFILDEFDEYSPKEKNGFLRKLIKGDVYPESTIIVTSRPRGIEDINERYFTMMVEIVGFSQLDIDRALLQVELPLRSVIKEHLDNNPNVKKMCYLPLHMTMIIYLASLKKDALSGVDSETKIYTSFLHLTIDHYRERHGQNSSILNICIKDPSSSHSLCRLFMSICELAFNTTISRQQTFTSDELLNTPVTADDLEELSLFYIRKEHGWKGRVDVFAFSHSTFQEFMAAFHLVLLPKRKQQEMIKRYGNHPVFQDLVWKFFFGLAAENKELKPLLRLYVSQSRHYKRMSSGYFAIDLLPLVYAFETGKKSKEFEELLDYAKIVGPRNNYSLHIVIQEPMDLRSFLNIGQGGTNFLFMRLTLEWILVRHLRIELQLQLTSTIPDRTICTNKWLLSLNRTGSERLLRSYCNQTHTDSVNVTSVILELEYFQERRNTTDPQLVFNMLKTAILPDRFYAQHFRQMMIQFALKKGILSPISIALFSNFSVKLNREEESFMQLWRHLEMYSKIVIPHEIDSFSELRKFKLQLLLVDTDLKEVCPALKSAKRLEVLDLSHNQLLRPKALLDLFSSLQKLQILDLSDNDIQLNFIARGFMLLKGLTELSLSGNILNRANLSSEQSFGSQLVNLKELRSLDLSRILYQTIDGFALGLRALRNLRSLNLSKCMIEDAVALEELLPSLSSLQNLRCLDLSHNVIEYLSPEAAQVLSSARELNLSHNMLNLPLSEIALLRSSSNSKLRILDLSYNFLCGSIIEFHHFLGRFIALPKLQRVDLSHNKLFLGNLGEFTSYLTKEVTYLHQGVTWDSTRVLTIPSESGGSKSVVINSGIEVPDMATQLYAQCICTFAGFESNYEAKCSNLFLAFCQECSQLTEYGPELKSIHYQVAAGYHKRLSRSLREIDSVILDRTKRSNRITAINNKIDNALLFEQVKV